MFFSNEDKIKRIAKRLQTQLAEYHQDRWANFFNQVAKLARIDMNSAVNSMTPYRCDPTRILNIPPWFRPKEDFYWPMDFDALGNTSSDFTFACDNAFQQMVHYKTLLDLADNLVKALEVRNPKSSEIIGLVNRIKDSYVNVPSIINGDNILINIGYFTGGNLLVDFMSGIGGLVYAPALMLAGLLLAPSYYWGESLYCGSPLYFLDVVKYFCDSLCKVISSLIFPLAILRSKYETDSYNPCKGELMRSLDAIVALVNTDEDIILDTASFLI